MSIRHLGFCTLTRKTLLLYHIERETQDTDLARSEHRIPSKIDTIIEPPELISWLGMEELKVLCMGIILLEIGHLLPDAKDLLTLREADRAEELGPRRHRHFTAARMALKRLARKVGVVHKDTPDSGIETIGPDRVKPCLAESDLHCSVSHTNRFVVAAANVHSVGVDMEVVSEKTLRIWHLFMPSKDSDLLLSSGIGPERAATRAWTVKEAAAKAFGLNLSEAIREVKIVRVGEKESQIRHRGKTYPVKHAEGDGHVLSLLVCDGV